MPPAGFEPTIPASERPQTDALDRAATDIGKYMYQAIKNSRVVYRYSNIAAADRIEMIILNQCL